MSNIQCYKQNNDERGASSIHKEDSNKIIDKQKDHYQYVRLSPLSAQRGI